MDILTPWERARCAVQNDPAFFSALGLAALAYGAGFPIDLFDTDTARYANIARELAQHGNFFSLTYEGKDWLDKPHLPFWLTAVSYQIFGVNNVAYKIPGFLCIIVATLYTYALGKRYSNREVARWGVLILLSSQHLVAAASDVKAEPFLLAFITQAFYHLQRSLEQSESCRGAQRWFHFVMSALGTAAAIGTKGPFVLVPILGGHGVVLVLRGRWREILHPKWIAYLAATSVFLSPIIVAYYVQFDMHPDKELFGRTSVSGVKFFLWDSQVGRLFNDGPIRMSETKTVFHFFGVMFRSYVPWVFMLYYSVVFFLRRLGKQNDVFLALFFSSLATFVMFSISPFQVDHYLIIVFALFSLVVAQLMRQLEADGRQAALEKWWVFHRVYLALGAAVVAVAPVLLRWNVGWELGDVLLVLGVTLWVFVRMERLGVRSSAARLVVGTAVMVFGLNYVLNRVVYPGLMKYQGRAQAAKFVRGYAEPSASIFQVNMNRHIVDFYLERITPSIAPEQVWDTVPIHGIIITDDHGIGRLDDLDVSFESLVSFLDYHVGQPREDLLVKLVTGEGWDHVHVVRFLGMGSRS